MHTFRKPVVLNKRNDFFFGIWLLLFDELIKVKVKGKVSLCLTKHHAMKTYWGQEV
jgi:hypothetical protein